MKQVQITAFLSKPQGPGLLLQSFRIAENVKIIKIKFKQCVTFENAIYFLLNLMKG